MTETRSARAASGGYLAPLSVLLGLGALTADAAGILVLLRADDAVAGMTPERLSVLLVAGGLALSGVGLSLGSAALDGGARRRSAFLGLALSAVALAVPFAALALLMLIFLTALSGSGGG